MPRVISTGIPGSAPFTLNLTLWVGLLGAAIAARDGKLLTLATGEFLPKRIAGFAHVVGGAVGAAIAAMFAVGGVGLVLTERTAGDKIALNVPVWVSALAFPIGFTLIALRLGLKASPKWSGRTIAAIAIVAGAFAAWRFDLFEGHALLPWIELLEQSIRFSLVVQSDRFYAKFNVNALLRMDAKTQATQTRR